MELVPNKGLVRFCLYIQNVLNLFIFAAKHTCWRKEKDYFFFRQLYFCGWCPFATFVYEAHY